MDLNLDKKVGVVTGGSRGIGKGIALALAAEGCQITICARKEEDLHACAKEIKKLNVDVLALAVDVTKSDEVINMVKATITKFGKIDILVNNVGGNRRKRFEDTIDDDWQEIININLMAHIQLTRAVIPSMIKQKSGSIIFISSIFGRESGGKNLSIYNTTKSALISLSKVLATELISDGIRVNSVAPGSIRFPGGSWDRRCKEDPEGMKEFIKRELPLGRFGTVEEVANLVAFLASDRASLMSGSCINIDGCQSRSLI